MAEAERVLEIARGELGERESPPASNSVKYNSAYYGRDVSGSGYAWCAVFLWWVFKQAGASSLYYGGGKTAYCPALLAYYRERGQAVRGDYRPGDIIFFNFSGGTSAKHVGLCESWDGTRVTTIDGNTGTDSEASGGAVMRRTRHKKYIVGACRPAYAKEEQDLTEEQVRKIVREELGRLETERAGLGPSEWAETPLAQAKERGVTDGTRPQSFATRQETALMVMAALR